MQKVMYLLLTGSVLMVLGGCSSDDGSSQSQDSSTNVGAVTDIDPTENTVAEDATTGITVGITAEAIDPDAGSTVIYALTDDAGGRFAIDENTGVVTVVFNGPPLDYETADEHNITVRATSSDGSTSSADMRITVTGVDEPDGYGVISYGGYQWLDRSLGASDACIAAAVFYNDTCLGDYYQWGRSADGHEDLASNITNVLSDTEDPGHGDFIITEDDTAANPSLNWISSNIPGLWQLEGNTTLGDNGVCPAGWRVPTRLEFESLAPSAGGDDLDSNMSDVFAKIRLHTSSHRADADGNRSSVVSTAFPFGFYWTSTVDGNSSSFGLRIDASRVYFNNDWGRANGFQVRCIKDY